MKKNLPGSLLRIRQFPSIFLLFIFFSISGSVFGYDAVVDKTGAGGAYTTVQAALNAAPTNAVTPWVIFIKNGKYREKISVASNKTFIQLVGESVANVFIYYDDPATILGTQNSASFSIAGNDFTAINITFANTFGDGSQAVAVLVNADRAAFKNCRFLGNQDTLYLKGSGTPRQYFRNCYIDGNVDFIFGSAAAVFDSCVIYAKTRPSTSSSYITAPNTPSGQTYGFVFRDNKLMNNTGGTLYYLSRPWPSPSEAATRQKAVYLSTVMSSHIQPTGWSTWDANTITANLTYAEYNSKYFNGSLVDVSQRVPWSYQFTQSDSATYTNANIFGSWDPCGVMAGFCNVTNGGDIAVSNFRGTKGTTTSTFNWNISWPISGIQYDLYRSNDNVSFSIINTQTSVNDTAVNFNYTEAIPPPSQTYYYYIRASKAGYIPHITDTIQISSTPTITTSGTLGSFVQGVGIPSNTQAYTVSGASLTNDIIITAPAGYEISSNGGTTWNNSATPITLSPVSGNVATTTISVRLNAASAGAYSGNITHTSTGAASVNVPVTGNVQSTPLTQSVLLQQWPFTTNNLDSATVRAAGVTASTPTFAKLFLSNGTTLAAVPAYSTLYGEAYGASSNGDGTWTTAVGGPGGNLNRTIYEQFTVTATSTYSLRIDSLILNSSFYNTNSNTKLAVVYSKTGFTTADSTDVTGTGGLGSFANPILLNNETAGTNSNYRIAFNGTTGITLNAGQTLTFRIYNSCGSSSNGRYGKIKNLYVTGLSTLNPVAGDYQTHQSGDWTDLNTWERYDGTNWVTPAPAYPVYNNSGLISILSGHAVTVSATLANGSGYIHRTVIKQGGSMILAVGATLNLANDAPAVGTTDLQIDGTFTANGQLGTNGNVVVVINGTFVNSTTSMNLSNAGDSVYVNNGGIYQHNTNSNNTPANLKCQPGSMFAVTGISTSQTGIFKPGITYGNISWNCPSQTNYYAIRDNLTSNVAGSFTVANTGTQYITFGYTVANAKVTFPGGYYQTGGSVKFYETNPNADTLFVGSDFNVTGGTFASNASGPNTLNIKLTGTNKTITYAQSAVNTNWFITGIYDLATDLALPSTGFGMTVSGTLNMGTDVISGPGRFTLSAAGILSSAAATGLDGNITVSGTKTFGTTGNLIFNGTGAQTTGTSLPAAANALTVNNPADLTLTAGTALAGTLTLTQGKLILGANTIATPSLVGNTITKYIVTNGTGKLKINNVGAGNTVFPIGPSATAYNPITISNSGIADNFAVSVKTTIDNAPLDPTKVVNMQWDISEDVPGGSSVTLTPTWNAASAGTGDEAPAFDRNAATVIGHYNGIYWEETAATVAGANPYTATAGGFTSFSPFIVGNIHAIPLTLLSFNASSNAGVVKLSWRTENEINASHFEIERSADGRSFNNIGNVNANNGALSNVYSFNDPTIVNGVAYYRLKMVDKDGKFKYSIVIAINNKKGAVLSIFPNPVKENVFVTHAKAVAGATIELYAFDGRKISSYPVITNATQTTISLDNFAKGNYQLVFVNGADIQYVKLIKQ
ncbi:MAG: pectinesterase family protein [Ferruginibacter sp.]